MKILVVGFPRSGTSLTYRIFDKHPEIKRMFFETFIIRNRKKKNLINLYKQFAPGVGCGEKIIYTKPVIGKEGSLSAIEYCERWNNYFKSEARIIQPVRHPIDSWNSMLKNSVHRKKKDFMERLYHLYFKTIPKYTEIINSFPNCFTFKYENLVMNRDDVVRQLYLFCNLSPFKFNERMKKGRVFSSQKLPFKDIEKMQEALDIFNQFEGPKYELYTGTKIEN
jgi:hypothetical protein